MNRKHPDSGKRQTLLNFSEWQRGQAARILQDFELHVYEWTLTAVKHRESLDKQDKRDVAQSVFAQDRDGRLLPHMVFLRAQVLARDDDDDVAAEQAAVNTNAFRQALIDELVADEENDVTERDRAVLMTGVEMTRTEFDLLLTLVRVYDHARSHFVFEICEPAAKRFLNALRIRFEEGGERMPWIQYKTSLLDREDAKLFHDRRTDLIHFETAGQQLPYQPVGGRTSRGASLAERRWDRHVRRHVVGVSVSFCNE